MAGDGLVPGLDLVRLEVVAGMLLQGIEVGPARRDGLRILRNDAELVILVEGSIGKVS